jgi:outer membrane protein assembly factor BamB
MAKIVLLIGSLVVGGLLIPVTFWLGSMVLPEPKSRPALNWRWSDEKATLAYCTKEHLADYEVELVEPEKYYTTINIRNKDDRKAIYSIIEGHKSIVFTRWQDTLFIAEFSPASSGCAVVALDLKTGKRIWRTDLEGIGPTGHSEYSNQVNIETDGDLVIVYGNEAHGKYVEQLNINTGKTVANTKFELSTKR